jgi:uncharacterized protein
VSSILLGVRDLDQSKRFYAEGLGWKVQRDYGVSVFFEPNGGSLVGFYGRDGWWPAVPRSSRSRPSGSTGFVTAPSAIRGQPDPHQRAPSWE